MRAPKVPVGIIVLVMGVLLLAFCVGWAVLVQEVVPDVCTYPSPETIHDGPIRCQK